MNQMQKQSKLHESVKNILEDHHRDDLRPLLNSSKDKDIVVLLGATGSGKSTLVNYLINKDMFVTKDEEFVLIDTNDPAVMKIGNGGKSETLIPKSAQIGSLIFYDLPGFKDNRGTATNLVNASFIKNIIENARTVRLVFVAGQDEITASRGDSLKNLLNITQILLPQSNALQKSSIFVITKSLKNTPEEMIEYLSQRIEDIEMMNIWLTPSRIQPMSKRIDHGQKDNIIKKINSIIPSNITYVNIEAIFSTDLRNDLKDIFEIEMSSSLDKIHNKQPKKLLNIGETDYAISYYINSFQRDVINDLENSTMIKLLKPLSEQIYLGQVDKFLYDVKEKINLSITQLNLIRSELEKEELHRQQQIQLENQRQIQKKLEEEHRLQLELIKEQNLQLLILLENKRQAQDEEEEKKRRQAHLEQQKKFDDQQRIYEEEKLDPSGIWPRTQQQMYIPVSTDWVKNYYVHSESFQGPDVVDNKEQQLILVPVYKILFETSYLNTRWVRISPTTGKFVVDQDWQPQQGTAIREIKQKIFLRNEVSLQNQYRDRYIEDGQKF